MRRTRSAFVIAGTHSGVGKTMLCLGILAALRKRGVRVQPFKVGPDFIDPGHHTAVTGLSSYALDGWMLSQEYNRRTFESHSEQAEVAVVEGVMGLFDGYEGKSEAGSTAEMAKWLRLPVILVIDASAMARSVAALIHGFRSFDQELKVAGVVFNRIGGPGHLQYLREAVVDVPDIAVLGGLPLDELLSLPERHLGLVPAEEHKLTPERIDRLASFVEENLDLTRILQLTARKSQRSKVRGVGGTARGPELASSTSQSGTRTRLGIARDAAFCFYYPDNLALLEQAGAELVFFSPLRDAHLPVDLYGIYLGGGYPEVYAERLAENVIMREEINTFIGQGKMVYAECGGFMYLTEGIRDTNGRLFPMVGIYPTTARMLPRLAALGYVEVEITADLVFLSGQIARGHEFHYSVLEPQDFCGGPITATHHVRRRHSAAPRPEGYLYKRCLAGYVHLHFGSNPQMAVTLVETVRRRSVP